MEGPRPYQELGGVGNGAVGEGVVKCSAATVSLQTSGAVFAFGCDANILCTFDFGRIGNSAPSSHPRQDDKPQQQCQYLAVACGRHDRGFR